MGHHDLALGKRGFAPLKSKKNRQTPPLPHLSSLHVLPLDTTQQQPNVVTSLTLLQQLLEHLNTCVGDTYVCTSDRHKAMSIQQQFDGMAYNSMQIHMRVLWLSGHHITMVPQQPQIRGTLCMRLNDVVQP